MHFREDDDPLSDFAARHRLTQDAVVEREKAAVRATTVANASVTARVFEASPTPNWATPPSVFS